MTGHSLSLIFLCFGFQYSMQSGFGLTPSTTIVCLSILDNEHSRQMKIIFLLEKSVSRHHKHSDLNRLCRRIARVFVLHVFAPVATS